MSRPKVTVNCVAQQHAGQEERIIEFSHENGGGLISFTPTDDGRMVVSLYNVDGSIIPGGRFTKRHVSPK